MRLSYTGLGVTVFLIAFGVFMIVPLEVVYVALVLAFAALVAVLVLWR